MQLKAIITSVIPTINKRLLRIQPSEPISSLPFFEGLVLPESYPNFTDEFQEAEKFFYILSKYRHKQLLFREKGIGSIVGGNFSRDTPTGIGLDQLNPPVDNKLLDFSLQEDGEYVVLESTFPASFLEAYEFPHSVLASSEGSINIVEIQPNSLLGRFGQDIASVSIDSIRDHLLNDPVFIQQIRDNLL